MLIYRVDADTAFELLRWRSQETDVTLRILAELGAPPPCGGLLTDFAGLVYEETNPPRAAFDHLLLTAHQRVDAAGPGS
jgi:hypothetical protein